MLDEITELQPEQDADVDAEPRVVTLGSEDAELVFDALGSETSRAVYQSLLTEPRTASALADAVDASIQTVGYHLDNLDEAGLVEPAGTRYSDRGREMTVWAPTASAVVVTDDGRDTERLRDRVGAVLGLAVLAVGVDTAVGVLARRVLARRGALEPAGLPADPSPIVATLAWLAGVVAGAEVGLSLFVGGLVVLLARWLRE